MSSSPFCFAAHKPKLSSGGAMHGIEHPVLPAWRWEPAEQKGPFSTLLIPNHSREEHFLAIYFAIFFSFFFFESVVGFVLVS